MCAVGACIADLLWGGHSLEVEGDVGMPPWAHRAAGASEMLIVLLRWFGSASSLASAATATDDERLHAAAVDLTTWTILQNNDPNHLDERLHAAAAVLTCGLMGGALVTWPVLRSRRANRTAIVPLSTSPPAHMSLPSPWITHPPPGPGQRRSGGGAGGAALARIALRPRGRGLAALRFLLGLCAGRDGALAGGGCERGGGLGRRRCRWTAWVVVPWVVQRCGEEARVIGLTHCPLKHSVSTL